MTLSLLFSILLMPGVALAEGGGVAGTVRGTDGTPAARVRVGVMAIPEPGRGVRGAGTLVSQGQTDDDGRFQLQEVPPGRYYIVAGNLKAPTYYPGVPKMDTAKLIEVRAKATVRDINFAVNVSSSSDGVPTANVGSPAPLPLVSVRGRVVLKNSTNAPMPRFITLQGSQVMPLFMTVAVAADGMFNIPLPAGDQRLSAVGLPDGYSVVSITSGGRNVLNQPIDVKAGIELLVSAGGGDDLRPRYRLMAVVREASTERPLVGEHVELVDSSREVVRLAVNAQGMVTFARILPGTYVLRLASAGFDVTEKKVLITDSSVQVELRARKRP
jgi:Carboxypeptidase regulatory-like domain